MALQVPSLPDAANTEMFAAAAALSAAVIAGSLLSQLDTLPKLPAPRLIDRALMSYKSRLVTTQSMAPTRSPSREFEPQMLEL